MFVAKNTDGSHIRAKITSESEVTAIASLAEKGVKVVQLLTIDGKERSSAEVEANSEQVENLDDLLSDVAVAEVDHGDDQTMMNSPEDAAAIRAAIAERMERDTKKKHLQIIIGVVVVVAVIIIAVLSLGD